MALADLIYQHSVNQPNLVDTFQSARSSAMERQGLEQKLLSNQRTRQRQSALQGLLATGGTPEEVFRQDPATGLKMAEFQKLKREGEGGIDNVEFLKEERKTASQDVRSFNKSAKEMRTNYGQLQGLAAQAKTGGRGARNAMVVTLARLISPGIVTETEAASLSGGQNTMQAVISGLSGKGVDTDALLRNIDPYGDSFDSDALLRVGESVVASGRKPLLDMYEGSRNRATRANMSQRAFETNFGSNPNFEFLTSFQPGAVSQAPPPPQAPTRQAAPQQPQQPQTGVDVEALNWAKQNPNDPRATEILRLQGN